MSGIINAASKNSYKDPNSNLWEYYQDNEDASIFYVMPRPQLAISRGAPQFHLEEYVDDDGDFVAGLCQLTTSLAPVPDDVQSAIARKLSDAGVSNPQYQAMPFQSLGDGVERNRAYLNFASADGMVSRNVQTIPSLSGSQNAVFDVTNMSKSEVAFFKDYFGGNTAAGSMQIVYQLTLIAHLGGVTAKVQFDAKAAYDYQRTYKWVS